MYISLDLSWSLPRSLVYCHWCTYPPTFCLACLHTRHWLTCTHACTVSTFMLYYVRFCHHIAFSLCLTHTQNHCHHNYYVHPPTPQKRKFFCAFWLQILEGAVFKSRFHCQLIRHSLFLSELDKYRMLYVSRFPVCP